MNYEYQNLDYTLFLIKEAYNQRQMDLWIQEALMWTSDTFTKDKLDSLNESLKDTLKEKFVKMWEAIKKAFRKVYHGIGNFMKKDETFLEDNKDIIIGKKVIFTESIDLYPYEEGIKRMVAYPIPEFNYDQVKNNISDDEADFQKTLTTYFKIGSKITANKDDLREKCEDFFRGGPEKTYNASDLNMTHIYNTCIDYKKTIKGALEKDVNVIEKTDEKMKLALDKVNINNESSYFNDEPSYSNFFETYITEADAPGGDQQQGGQQQGASSGGQGNAVPEKDGISNKTNNAAVTKTGEAIKNSSMDKSKVDTKSGEEITKDVNNNKEEYDKLVAKCELYTSIASSIAQAKVTVFSEMYKTYMDIIHKHYNSYSGQAKDDKEGNRAKSAAVDYNNGLSPEAEKALENQKGVTNVEVRATDANKDNKNPNGYVIKITVKGDDGEEVPVYQSVQNIYPAKDENNFVAGSAKPLKKDGIWKLVRKYNIDGQVKIRGVNIVLGKPTVDGAQYIEANKTTNQ